MNEDLIKYRLSRAKETLKDAEILISNNRLNSTVNRIYYSLYYAVLALLETKELASSKHSGVRALFNQYFVKTGIVSKETGRFFSELFNDRQEGDYVDYTKFEVKDVKNKFEKCNFYIGEIEQITEKT
ncbi:MAG: HEPN domain-containing protein, partial [Desulfurellaceae bacterium]|nr:HEPN domain-containing protein [Desulfurellaceae bacterium]